MSNLAGAEQNSDFDLVASLEPITHAVHFEADVVFGGLGTNPNFFYFNRLLTLFRLPFFFRALVHEFAIIHDTGDGRVGVGRHFDEIEIMLARDNQCIAGSENPKLFA